MSAQSALREVEAGGQLHTITTRGLHMADQVCIIGRTITIRGNLSGTEDLQVEGRIEGTVTLSNHLTVESSAVIEADLDVGDLTVSGTVRGDIRASRQVSINAEAKLTGNIHAPRVIIQDGAHYNGRIEMEVDLPEGLRKNLNK
jgi:cytoskeletal protein CcmA (bactofilin family)